MFEDWSIYFDFLKVIIIIFSNLIKKNRKLTYFINFLYLSEYLKNWFLLYISSSFIVILNIHIIELFKAYFNWNSIKNGTVKIIVIYKII